MNTIIDRQMIIDRIKWFESYFYNNTSEDNIFHVEILRRPISEVTGKRHNMKAKLIDE